MFAKFAPFGYPKQKDGGHNMAASDKEGSMYDTVPRNYFTHSYI